MGKLTGYIIALFTLHLAAYFALGIPLPQDLITNILNDPWSYQSLYNSITLGLAGIGAAGIVIGLYITKSEFPVYAGIALIIGSYGLGLVSVVEKLQAQGAFNFFGITVPTIFYNIIFIPFVVMWAFILLDWARGRD